MKVTKSGPQLYYLLFEQFIHVQVKYERVF